MSESQAEPTPQGGRRRAAQDPGRRRARLVGLDVRSLAYGKLAPDLRDLEQARLAIDALRALLPLIPEEHRRDIQEVAANLQLAYADAAKDA